MSGIVTNIVNKPESTIQGSGGYTIPAGKTALLSAHCVSSTSGWSAYNDPVGYVTFNQYAVAQNSSANSVNQESNRYGSATALSEQFLLVAGDSITTNTDATNTTFQNTNGGGPLSNSYVQACYHDNYARMSINGTVVLEAKSNAEASIWVGSAQANPVYVGTRWSGGVGWSAAVFSA